MIRCFLIISLSYLSLILHGQGSYTTHYANRDYDNAIRTAKEHLQSTPNDSMAMYIIGASYVNMQKWSEAEGYLMQAQDSGLQSIGLSYVTARLRTYQKREEEALDLLEEMAGTGMGNYVLLDHDDLKSLQDNERWAAARLKIYKVARPCEFDDNYRRFDFWVGEWDVYAGGAKIADSWISHSNDKCGILEDYKTLGVFAGNSITYYDAADSLWKQNWIAGGGATHFVETTRPYVGDLSFTTERVNAQGQRVINRMTFHKVSDDEVRQHIETSTDDGTTWTTSFDGTYRRKG